MTACLAHFPSERESTESSSKAPCPCCEGLFLIAPCVPGRLELSHGRSTDVQFARPILNMQGQRDSSQPGAARGGSGHDTHRAIRRGTGGGTLDGLVSRPPTYARPTMDARAHP